MYLHDCDIVFPPQHMIISTQTFKRDRGQDHKADIWARCRHPHDIINARLFAPPPSGSDNHSQYGYAPSTSKLTEANQKITPSTTHFQVLGQSGILPITQKAALRQQGFLLHAQAHVCSWRTTEKCFANRNARGWPRL